MTLQECLDILARGRLSNLSICDNGHVKESFIPKVIDAINEALQNLYITFPLKEKSVSIELVEGKTDYKLTSEHSWLKRQEDENHLYDRWDYYVIDTEENPFKDDILCIMEVWDDLQRRRSINDPDDPLGIYIPEENFIIVKTSEDGLLLNIAYRAKHNNLTINDLTAKVDIPECLNNALFSYVAYLIHSDMNTEQAVANAQKYYMDYQNIINNLKMYGFLSPDKLVSDIKFFTGGWV